MNKSILTVLLTAALLIPLLHATDSTTTDEARLLRFPAVFANQVVFSYAGDLYTVDREGGVARKLTTHKGYEMFPRFSPDGRHIAFTGQYDGNTEVYLIPSEGGVPKRLTFTAALTRDDVSDRMGPNNIVMGWKHDNRHILFRSRMIEPNDFNGQLFVTTVDGDQHRQLPLPRGGFCSFSPDDTRIAYNRIFREFRTWKRYRGGMADDIWIHDFNTRKTVNITDHPAQDIIPMWRENKIYFLSDRDALQKMNLYVYDLESRTTRKLTEFEEFDIKFPSLGDDAIAFENGGYIYLYDLNKEALQKVSVRILDDRLGARKALKSLAKSVTNFEISPDGHRALFGARGEIFTVPAKDGNTRNLTRSPGIHERNSKWSPDGAWIAFISDRSGENEIYIVKPDGHSTPVQITQGADTYKYGLLWSPDSKKLLWSDKKLRLRYVDIDKKSVVTISQGEAWEIRNFNWSPDSQWVTYDRQEMNGNAVVYLYSLSKAESRPVTDAWHHSTGPAFSEDGKYLAFLSARDFNPVIGWTEYNHVYIDMMRPYLLTLAQDIPSPFKPKSDETGVQSTAATQTDKKGDTKKETATGVRVNVDLEGIGERIIGIPVKPSRYWSLSVVKDRLYVMRRGAADSTSVLVMYDLGKQKETELGKAGGYEISADAKKMLLESGGKYAILDLPVAPFKLDEVLDLSGMETVVCYPCEWKQIFLESWRQMRDFFYAPNMHGVDWTKMRDRYLPLIKHVNHRNDLTYVIGEMIGELNIGHTYVGGGERPQLKTIATGLLGARIEKDAGSGYFKIEKILKGQNWDPTMVSPLTRIGVSAREGDYIIEIDGESSADMNNIYASLVNKVGKQVSLTLNSQPRKEGGRSVVVEPIASEHSLYYYNWVQENIRKVNEATNGKVGYIHIPDMGPGGLNEFAKNYYPQLRKKALIVDVRGNGGGSVSPMIVERLRREIAMIDVARNTASSTNPDGMLWGPMVCMLDEFSASDGDIFPYRFKKYKLGKLIGKRSWGGVVGIRGSLPLLDGGQLFKPEFASYDVAGKEWPVEGRGVEPDIVVDNDPAQEFAGVDQQLNKAIEVILEELKSKEKTIPAVPPYPVKVPEKK